MAARKLTPVGAVTKWILVPAALGALGYYWLGPRFAGREPEPPKQSPQMGSARGQEMRSRPAPKVDVESRPARSDRS